MKILNVKKMGHYALNGVIVVAALIVASAVWRGNAGRPAMNVNEKDNSLQKVLDAGCFILGFDAHFPPMGFTDEKGESVGFDIDMVQEICSRLGVALFKRPIPWDAKEAELDGGIIDCIGSMSVTPEAIREMNLSEPYIKEDLIFVVPGNSNVMWMSDLKGKRVGVQAGSSTQKALEALDIYKDISVVLCIDNMAILQQLQKGNLDAALIDSPAAYYFLYSSIEPYFVLPDSLGTEKLAIGFRKNDKGLRDKVQKIISEMKADGTLGRISKKWFGSDITIVR